MRILEKKVNQLNKEDIQNLISNQIPESKTLDYKKEMKLDTGDDRKEFLADISAFLNTEGGVIIYGIEESKDSKGQNSALPDKITPIDINNIDKFHQQIENLIQNNLEPRLNNIIINPIKIENGKYVIVLGIRKSFGLPHMVTYKSTNKFYKRRNTGKYLVDVYELQNLFNHVMESREQAESFRKTRINKVRNLEYLPKLDIIGSYFLHIIPINSSEYEIDISSIATHSFLQNKMRPIAARGWDNRYNLEGFQTYSVTRQNYIPYSYSQFFRNGIIEHYTSQLHYNRNKDEKVLDIKGRDLELITIEYIKESFNLYEFFQIEPPFIIMISIFDTQNSTIAYQDDWRNASREISQDRLLLPPIILYNKEMIEKELKKLFDIMWQSGNIQRSPYYTESGNRTENPDF